MEEKASAVVDKAVASQAATESLPGTDAAQTKPAGNNKSANSTGAAPNSADAASNSADASAQVEGAAARGEDKKADTEPKKYKIKVNGKEKLVDEKTALAYLQRELAADEKFRRAAEEVKRVEAILKAAKENPDRFFSELVGMDSLEYSKKRIGEEIRRLTMTPEQRELEEYKAKVAEFEKKEKERLEAERRASFERAKEFYIKKYDEEIPNALKAAGLPVNEDTVRYTAEVMLANLEEGLDLPYEMVMEIVKDKYARSFKGFMTASDKEKLLELLGEDLIDSLYEAKAKKSGQKAQNQRPHQAVPDGGGAEDSGGNYMTRDQFREYVSRWSRS